MTPTIPKHRDDASADSPIGSPPFSRYRVTAFEALMLAQDAPAHPMTAQLQADYAGTLDRNLFEASLARTLAKHPLLRALIDRTDRPRQWIVHPEEHPYLDWADAGTPVAFPDDSEFIDLTQEIGLRIWIRGGRDGGRMIFQFHHACTDGTGVMEFFLDLLRWYDALAAGRDEPLPTRDPASLKRRDRFHKHTHWGRLRMLVGAVLRGWHWTRMKPIPLGEAVAAPRAARPMETIRHATLPAGVLDRLLTASRGAGATLNDLLLRDLFLVLSRHCAERASTAKDSLVVCMPVNLRSPHEPPMPAANKLMLTFLYRTPRECADPHALLRELRSETEHIKRTRRGLKILEVLRLVLKIQGKIPEALLKKSSFATAVLTNLGRLDALAQGLSIDCDEYLQTDGLTIRQIITAPNGQPGTAAVFLASTYAQKLTIAICHDPRALPRERAEMLLAKFVEQLQATAGTDPDESER